MLYLRDILVLEATKILVSQNYNYGTNLYRVPEIIDNISTVPTNKLVMDIEELNTDRLPEIVYNIYIVPTHNVVRYLEESNSYRLLEIVNDIYTTQNHIYVFRYKRNIMN